MVYASGNVSSDRQPSGADSMAGSSTSHIGIILCTLTCIGILANVVLLIWKLVKHRTRKDLIIQRYNHILIHTAYILCGLGILLLFVFDALPRAGFLCKAGGFFVLFSGQFCLWSWVLYTGDLFLQQSKKRGPMTSATAKRRCTIYILIVAAKTVVLLALSFLPYIDIHYFDTKSKYYYMCTPIRLPGEMGWAYSTLIVVLSWMGIISAVVLTTCSILRFRKSSASFCKRSYQYQSVQVYAEYFALHNKKSLIASCVSICANLVGWGTVLLIFSISYFSGGAPYKDTIQWALGYSLAVVLIVHAALRLALGGDWFLGPDGSSPSGEDVTFTCKYLEKKTPAKLDKLERLPTQQVC